MNERTYLVEVLLRAREQISQVAQRAAKALDNVTTAQDRMSESSKRAAQSAAEQRGALQQLYESRLREKRGLDDSATAYRNQERGLRQNAAAMREQARQTRASADELRRLRTESQKSAEGYVRESQSLLKLAQARQDDVGKIDKTVEGLRRQAAGARRMADENRRVTQSFDQQIGAIDRNAASFERSARATESSARTAERDAIARERSSTSTSRSINSLARQIAGLDERTNRSNQSSTRFGRSLDRLGFSGGNAAKGLRGLNAEVQGLALALAIKYAQSLITALAGLAAQFVAVAAAAGQAAAGIAGALGAGAAQAVPVIGVLAASFARLAAVLKVVKLQNQEQLRASQEAQTAARAQRTANDQITSAEQRVADAHRNTARAVEQLSQARSDAAREQARAQAEVARAQADADRNVRSAQQDVTQARKDAIRTVEDLIDAEKQSVLSVENAQSALRRAIREGDVAGAAQAQIDVGTAQRGATRARQDAAPVRARGVEGVQGVIDAEQRLTDVRRQGQQQVLDAEQRLADVRRGNERQLASSVQSVTDARRQEASAATDLSRTRRDAKENLDQETSSVNKLHDALMQLSPAERTLYERVLALQGVYKRVARPITDILTGAFTGVVDTTIAKLRDPRIIAGFRGIAVQIAASIRAGTREAGGRQSTSAFEIFSAEAARNIPVITRIVLSFFRTARSLAIDALPAFRRLLGYVSDYAKQLEGFVTSHPQGLRNFFDSGVQYAKKFFDLGLAVIKLLLAIGGEGGVAAEGAKTVDYLTGVVDRLTQKVKDNAGAIRNFFVRSRDVIKPVLDIIGALGLAIIQVFDPESVTALSDFIAHVLIPAFAGAIQILGVMVKVFHQFLTLPMVEPVVKVVATMLVLAKSLTIVRTAILEIIEIIPTFLRSMGLMLTAEEAAAAGLGLFASITPIGWIVIAVMAIVAAIVLLNKHFHFLGPTFKWLKGAATDTFNWLKNAAVDAFHWVIKAADDVISWFSDVWNHGLLKWIRAPFEAAVKIFGNSTWGRAIVDDVKAVFGAIVLVVGTLIDFFKGPAWAEVKAMIVLPFDVAKAAVLIVWAAIRSYVQVSLDIIAGRFDRIGKHLNGIWAGVWGGILDSARSALNILIDMINAAIDQINKISPFKDIGHVGHVGDDAKKQFDKIGTSADDAGNKQRQFATTTEKSTDRVNKAMDTTAQTAKTDFGKVKEQTDVGQKAFQDLADSGKAHLRDIREVTRNNMQDIASHLGKDSKEGKQALAQNFRDAAVAVKDQMDAGRVSTKNGMRAIRGFLAQELQVYGLSISDARNIVKGGNRGRQYGDPQNNLGREGGASDVITRAGGGMVSSYGGWPRDDHAVMDPYGRVSAYVSGNEGIVNPPQMARINQWGSIVKGLGLDSYGSLNELWGLRGGGVLGGHSSKARRFQRGGFLQLPRNFRPTHDTGNLPGYPAIDVFGHPGEHVGSPISGRIVKLSGQAGGPGGGGAFGYSIYVSGAGRTYFLTHFGSRSVRLGQRVRRGQDIGTIADYPDRPDHIHEGLHGGPMSVQGSAAAVDPAVALRLVPRPRIRGGGDVGRAVQRALMIARAGANRLIRGSSAAPDAGTPTAAPADANVVAAFRRAIRATHPNRVERLALWEAGLVESGLRNLPYGDRDSLGSLQERTSIYGAGHAMNPLASALRFLRQVIAKRPWRGTAGQLAQSAQGSAFPGRYDAVRGQAARYLQGGGPLSLRTPRPVRAPNNAFTGVVRKVNSLFTDVLGDLQKMVAGLGRTKGLAKLIRVASEKLTEDGGVLDSLHNAVVAVADRGALALQRAQFMVTRTGPRRGNLTGADVARATFTTTQATGRALAGERTTLESGIAAEQTALAKAVKSKNKAAQVAARAALKNLRARLTQNTTDIAQNAQDQVEAIEAYQQALLDAVNQHADDANAWLDRAVRTAKAFGRALDPNTVLRQQVAVDRGQIAGLQDVMREALRTGNAALVRTVQGQIEELNTQIAEAVAQQFQNSIDAVNNEAQSQTTRLDRAARRAQVGGTDYLALGNTLVARQNVLAGQRAGLAALLGQAAAAGNIEQVVNLIDQIDELDTTMAENTQAIKDNTDAAFNARTEDVNNRFGFAQNVLTGAQGFFQAITDATGVDTTPQQRSALQTLGSSLVEQRQGLAGQLASLIGDSTATGLSGQDLVNYLLSIATGPRLQAIMDTLDPTQQQSFKDLVTALLGNVTATQENTKAITGLGGSNAQSFSSSFWTGFRVALFNGAGALLPQYATTIPGAAIGARVLNSGALMVHAGETVRPAVINRSWQENAGDTYHLNVTTPTQVLNPTDVGRQLAFHRKNSGR